MHILFHPSYRTVFLFEVHILIDPIISIYYRFLFCLWIRLSKPLDEVIVYPIPALLYLVKNLLQVSRGNHVFILVVTIPLVFLIVEIWLMHIFHFYVAVYEARVRFGTRVRVRVRVRDSAIFEKGGCGCGRTRRLKNY